MINRYTSLYIAILLLATTQFLEVSMLGFASTPIRGEIQASPEEYSLIAALYACVAVMSISQVRWFAERMGWRNYVLSSIAVYFVGCIVCSMSENQLTFTVGRIIMALGGSTFMTIGRILANTLPAPLRFNGISVFATGVLLGTMGGPWVAATAISNDHWQAMFWGLLGLTGMTALMTIFYAPKAPLPKDQWASVGSAFVLLLAITSFFILYLLQRSYYDFYDDGIILIGFLFLALGALITLLYIERQRKKPLLRLKEIITKRYVAGVALFGVCYFLIGTNNYIQPQYLSVGLGYSWETIGRFQAVALMFTMVIWLTILRVFLPKYPAPVKYWLFAFGSLAGYAWLFSSFSPAADVWAHIVPALILSGFFIGAGMGTTAMQTFRDFGQHEELFAHAYQLKNMLGQIVQALGTAVATIFWQWRQTVQYNNLNVRITASDPLYQQTLETLTQYFAITHESGKAAVMASAQQSQLLSQQVAMLAAIEYYWVLFWVALAVMIFTVAQRIFR